MRVCAQNMIGVFFVLAVLVVCAVALFPYLHKTLFTRVKEEHSVLLLGMDNSGKTTLCGLVSTGRLIQAAPTTQQNNVEYETQNARWNIIDLGGHTQARNTWHTYFATVSSIMYIIDVDDDERQTESIEELQRVYTTISKNDADAEAPPTPFCVILNKDDILRRKHGDEESAKIVKALIARVADALDGCAQKHIVRCSLMHDFNYGYKDAFVWLDTLYTARSNDDAPVVSTAAEKKNA